MMSLYPMISTEVIKFLSHVLPALVLLKFNNFQPGVGILSIALNCLKAAKASLLYFRRERPHISEALQMNVTQYW